MVTITKEHVHFTFSGSHKPVQTVPSGSTVRFETYDCFYNQLLPEGADITKIDSSKANAATGPLCVEEALPGDTCLLYTSGTYPHLLFPGRRKSSAGLYCIPGLFPRRISI